MTEFRAAFSFFWTLWPSMHRGYPLSAHQDSDLQCLLMVGRTQEGQLTGRSLQSLAENCTGQGAAVWEAGEHRGCSWSEWGGLGHRKILQVLGLMAG